MRIAKTLRDGLAMLGFIFILVVLWARANAQDKPKFEATENQTLRLKIKQLEFLSAQEHFQAATAAFNAEIKAVEKENGWTEEDVQFNPGTITFNAIPKAPTPAKKPAVAAPNATEPSAPNAAEPTTPPAIEHLPKPSK